MKGAKGGGAGPRDGPSRREQEKPQTTVVETSSETDEIAPPQPAAGGEAATAAGKRTLILHIGANKTGSSAIQHFLRLNAALLKSAGIAVAPGDLTPEGSVTGQHVPAIEALRKDLETGKTEMSARLRALTQELPPDAKLLISAENLSNPGGAHQLFADAAQAYDLRILLYIRRQDDLLLSSWQQWAGKVGDDFWAWMLQSVGVRGDWRVVLMQWEQIVPRDKIAVRIYDRARLSGGDVVTDFAEWLGIGHVLPECRRDGDANPSYSEAVLDFVQGNPQLFKNEHDVGMYRVIETLTGDAFHRNARESILTLKQRRTILARYTGSNTWVRQNYFPDSRAPLFKLPQASDYDFSAKEEIDRQKWALVASLIYGLSKKVL